MGIILHQVVIGSAEVMRLHELLLIVIRQVSIAVERLFVFDVVILQNVVQMVFAFVLLLIRTQSLVLMRLILAVILIVRLRF